MSPDTASTAPAGSADLAAVRAAIESRYMDQLMAIGDGGNHVYVQLKATATAAAAEIVDQFGSAVQVKVGFLPYPPPASIPSPCAGSPSPIFAAPGSIRAVIDLPSPRISHATGVAGKVILTNTGSKTLSNETGQPLLIYLFDADGTTVVGGWAGGVGGTGLDLNLKPGASQEIDAGGGTASCDLRLGYELPDGPYVARAAVDFDGPSGAGYFWSDPLAIQLVTP